MYLSLMKHEWLRRTRGSSFTREAATFILKGILILIVGSYFLALAFFLNFILQKITEDTFSLLNSILVYYFLFEIMMRYFLQSTPVLHIQPYLHLPVNKKKIVHFLLAKSIFSPMNLMTPLLFAPFAFNVVGLLHGIGGACLWLGSLFAISIALHYFIIYFKKGLDDSPIGLLIVLLLVVVFVGSQYLEWFNLGEATSPLFSNAVNNGLIIILCLFLASGFYILNYKYLLAHTYMEELVKEKSSTYRSSKVAFLDSYGVVGQLIQQELRLIFRHKRTRSLLIMSSFLMFYGLIFYNNPRYLNDMPGMLLFVGIFMTGVFMINYGQFMFSWNSSNYDFLMARPISAYDYLKSKYYLVAAVVAFCTILTVPYVYFGWKVLLINICMALFNLGINIFIKMNIAMWGSKKIDLQKGNAFNFQGVGAAQWLMGIPIIGAPYIFYLPMSLLGMPVLGIILIGFVGLMGIFFHEQLLHFTARRLLIRKYSIAQSFRNE